jgi:vitamin B12/bleomycin/antimicrobial peptide transport system ATP-binding/permease protein
VTVVAEPESTSPVAPDSLRYFRRAARGYWFSMSGWSLIGMLVVCVVLQLLVQYRLNLWNRDFFNALGARDESQIWRETRMLLILVAASVALSVAAVWGRMTFQRLWRDWLTKELIADWLADQHYQRVGFVNGQRQNAEYRITEDARIATEAPIDLAVGLLTSVLTAATFVTVLWNIGGDIRIPFGGGTVAIPGYLVIASILYAGCTTLGVVVFARNMVGVIERKNQTEADFKYVVARVNTRVTLEPHAEDATILGNAQAAVIYQWKRLCGQYMRTTLVSSGNYLLAPIIGLILCTPNYVMGRMTLGEVTQAAAAFVAVQGAFNWLVDNYPRAAEWLSSAHRVGTLEGSLDTLEKAEAAEPAEQKP